MASSNNSITRTFVCSFKYCIADTSYRYNNRRSMYLAQRSQKLNTHILMWLPLFCMWPVWTDLLALQNALITLHSGMKDPQGFCATSEAFFTGIMKSDRLKGFLFLALRVLFRKSIFLLYFVPMAKSLLKGSLSPFFCCELSKISVLMLQLNLLHTTIPPCSAFLIHIQH